MKYFYKKYVFLWVWGLLSLSFSIQAQSTYPNKSIKLIVGFAPGSSSDVAARVVGEKMSQILGQSVVVENRPGGSSNVAARLVANSNPDGYTLFLCTVANVLNYVGKGPTEVDLATDLNAISMIGSVPNLLVVHPSLNVHSVDQLVQLLKNKPNQIPYATAGNGTALHMAALLFSMMADVKMIHVPYQGSTAALTDLLAGRTSVMFAPTSTVTQHVKSGKLEALAITSMKRSALVPELATLNEQGLTGFESSVWFGVMSPNGVPDSVTLTLNKAIASAIQTNEVQAQFKAQGIESSYLNQKDFAAYIRAENTKWSTVIKSTNIKFD
jgi:tripartite-type tricarboxylate transporter receptor subunit TctC